MRSTLRFLEIANRHFGGDRLVFGYLDRWSRTWPKDRPVTFLDVGTGWADLPIRIVRWAQRHDIDVRITGIDSTPEIARLATANARRCPQIEIIRQDLASFAESGRRFDVVLASLFLHHIPDRSLIEVLRICDRLALRAVLFSDLRRSRSGYWATAALTRLVGNRVVQNDGPLSVRRAFTADELEQWAHQAGLPYLRARRHAFFRLGLAGEKPR